MKKTVLALLAALTGGVGFSGAAHAAADGAALYATHCAMCHQSSGDGVPGQFPPLKGRIDKIAASPEGKTYLTHVLLNGLAGSLKVGSGSYMGYMPSMSSMSDEEIAALLSYVSSLGGGASAPTFTADDIKKERATPLQPGVVLEEREKLNAAHPLP
ncbi:hypothetical protein CSR02_00150 [Acetobacter pomorum]|uniref:Cytochrome c domain-containing protein n=1 Tax=Acetobacter pomorum TaxID=65959 RepID=A0A2G4RG89_9PROT|nr:cytochrome c [Acetobacter pomorum]KDE20029.1 cytochrome C biogenesis protein DsbD [Acetobacter aceti 1023]PHY95589.1 hypothetical protein CSR02_00150 [Acetobacter pomorum]GBR47634.1 cytochrome c-552 class I [Acetobacter pomorum DSM 11825]